MVGGGYAGVMAANRLSGMAGVRVTLVDPRDRFVERIRLHQLAAGSADDASVPFGAVLATAVGRVTAAVGLVEAERRSLRLEGGGELRWDRLVLATGSGPGPSPAGVHVVASLEGAWRLRAAIAALRADPSRRHPVRVAVVGGGLTGIETAAELATVDGLEVTLHAADTIASGLSDRGAASVRRTLGSLGARVAAGAAVGDAVAGTPGDLDADLVVWATGFAASSLAARSGLPVDELGRVRVDPALRVLGQERIVAAGDGAVIDDVGYAYVRMSCAIGMPMGVHAGTTVGRAIAGESPTAFDAGYALRCISLGRRAGVAQWVTADDRPRRLVLTGRPGARLKEWVCRSTLRAMRNEADRPGSTRWPRGPRP